MYKIEVTYSIYPNGLCAAQLKVTETDEGFNSLIFAGVHNSAMVSGENWAEVERNVQERLEYARGVVKHRRALVETKPEDTVYEL